MLHIEHEDAPVGVRRQIAAIKSTPEWRSADPENPEQLRGFFDELDKDAIRSALVENQHGLCAYCMSRIDDTPSTRIEHIKPLSASKDNALDFSNMVAVCDGGASIDGNRHRVLCCDAAKGNLELKYLSPYMEDIEDILKYNRKGFISCDKKNSRAKDIEEDIELLKLNGMKDRNNPEEFYDTCTHLRQSRANVYKAATEYMEHLAHRNQLTIGKLEREIQRLLEMIPRDSYVGVAIYVYRKKIKMLASLDNSKN